MLLRKEAPAVMEGSVSDPKAISESGLRAIYLKKIVEVTIIVILIIINMVAMEEFRLHFSIKLQTLII